CFLLNASLLYRSYSAHCLQNYLLTVTPFSESHHLQKPPVLRFSLHLCFKKRFMIKILLTLVITASVLSCNKKNESVMKDVNNKDTLTLNESDIMVEEIPENCYMEATG